MINHIREIISSLTNKRDKEDEGNILNQLATEGLLSAEQFQQLSAVKGNLNAGIIAQVLDQVELD